MIEPYVLDLQEVDEMQVAVVGGKGADLGGLSRIDGTAAGGFCVTTDAFRRIIVVGECCRSTVGSISCRA